MKHAQIRAKRVCKALTVRPKGMHKGAIEIVSARYSQHKSILLIE